MLVSAAQFEEKCTRRTHTLRNTENARDSKLFTGKFVKPKQRFVCSVAKGAKPPVRKYYYNVGQQKKKKKQTGKKRPEMLRARIRRLGSTESPSRILFYFSSIFYPSRLFNVHYTTYIVHKTCKMATQLPCFTTVRL